MLSLFIFWYIKVFSPKTQEILSLYVDVLIWMNDGRLRFLRVCSASKRRLDGCRHTIAVPVDEPGKDPRLA